MPTLADRDPWVRPMAYTVGIAVLLGGLETVKGVVAGHWAPNHFGWTQAVLTNMPWWLLWAALAPAVLWLARAKPISDGRWGAIGIHAAASLMLSLAHLAISAIIVWAAVSHDFFTLTRQLWSFVAGYLVGDIVTYWAMLAAYTTYDAYRRLRHSERERHALELRAAHLETQMTEARLDALRMELNPHFLFNTLNTAAAMAERGEGSVTVQVLSHLATLLRRTLEDDREHEVPLEEELELLELYLDIERVRFGDRLTTDIQVDPAVRLALVPPLILQPLVENALRHGLTAVRGPIAIAIEARPQDGALSIAVRDTGRGLHASDGSVREGVGLRNARTRLATLHGASADIELHPVPAGGTEARIRMPLRLESPVRVGV